MCHLHICVYHHGFFLLLLGSIANLEVYEAVIPTIGGSDEEETTLVKSPDITNFISHDGDALAKLKHDKGNHTIHDNTK